MIKFLMSVFTEFIIEFFKKIKIFLFYSIFLFIFIIAIFIKINAATINIQKGLYGITPLIQDKPGAKGLPIKIIGEGLLGIAGTTTYSGTTTVGEESVNPKTNSLPASSGNLYLHAGASIGTPGTAVNITPTGRIFGPGTLIGNISNSGILAPGNGNKPILQGEPALNAGANMTVLGDYTQNQNGATYLYYNQQGSDKIVITGAADFSNGNIYITVLDNASFQKFPTIFTPITWESLKGPLPSLENGNLIFTPQDPNLVITPLPQQNGIAFSISAMLSGDPLGNTTLYPQTTTNISNLSNKIGSITFSNATIQNNTGTVTIQNTLAIVGNATITTENGSSTFIKSSIKAVPGASLTFNGSGVTNLMKDNPNLANTFYVGSGTLKINADFSSTNIVVSPGSIFGGAGRVGDVVLTAMTIPSTDQNSNNQSASISTTSPSSASAVNNALTLGSTLRAGSSIASLYMNSLEADHTNFIVKVDSSGAANTVVIAQDANLTNPTFTVLMDSGNETGVSNVYKKGELEFTAIQAQGNINISGPVTINWVNAKSDNNIPNPISFTIDTVSKPAIVQTNTSETLSNYLVLKASFQDDVTIVNDQQAIDASENITTMPSAPISSVSIPSATSPNHLNTAPQLSDHIELTNLVFQNNSSSINDKFLSPNNNTFKFKEYATAPPLQKGKSTIDCLLQTLSYLGPINFENNNKNLWIIPFINRSRVNKTENLPGNQGWQGGALFGFEKKGKIIKKQATPTELNKNSNNKGASDKAWSLGLLSGLTNSYSHLSNEKKSFSKSFGFLFGIINTFKYSTYKNSGNFSHEVLLNRTINHVNGQRYGIDQNDLTPYYAISKYKIITDTANFQLNFIAPIIPEDLTVRLDSGLTYVKNKYGGYLEYNAGTNNLKKSAYSNYSLEFYNGIGIRKFWNQDNIISRATAVYEYGYQLYNRGTSSIITTQPMTASLSPAVYINPPQPRQNKHYLQFNVSNVNPETGLKLTLGYSGVLYKNTKNHTMISKIEYLF